jgi:hypothetical protein
VEGEVTSDHRMTPREKRRCSHLYPIRLGVAPAPRCALIASSSLLPLLLRLVLPLLVIMSTAGLMGRQMRHRKERSKSKRKDAEDRTASAAILQQQQQQHAILTQSALSKGLAPPAPLDAPKPKRRVHHTKEGSLRNHRVKVTPPLTLLLQPLCPLSCRLSSPPLLPPTL